MRMLDLSVSVKVARMFASLSDGRTCYGTPRLDEVSNVDTTHLWQVGNIHGAANVQRQKKGTSSAEMLFLQYVSNCRNTLKLTAYSN